MLPCFLFAQIDLGLPGTTGMGGAANGIAKDWECIGINPANLGWNNNYRFSVETLYIGQHGSISINIKNKDPESRFIRKGLIINNYMVPVCNNFIANIKIIHHSSTIKDGYNAIINCGTLKKQVIFTEIKDESNNMIEHIRSDDIVNINMAFNNKKYNYIQIGQIITFREGCVKGFGKITSINTKEIT